MTANANQRNSNAVDWLRVQTYTQGVIGPSQPMLGPLADGGPWLPARLRVAGGR